MTPWSIHRKRVGPIFSACMGLPDNHASNVALTKAAEKATRKTRIPQRGWTGFEIATETAGGHVNTGPLYIYGAEPGDMLEA